MAFFVINGETLTGIADKIRAMLGVTGSMSTSAMTNNLETEQTNIANAFTAVGSMGGTVPNSKVSGNLVSAINSIPKGATVQVKSGTVTGVSGSDKTVTLGFKPDAVFFTTTNPHGGDTLHSGVAFKEANVTTMKTWGGAQNDNYILGTFTVTQTSNGFKLRATNMDFDYESVNANNRSLSYIAIKYS